MIIEKYARSEPHSCGPDLAYFSIITYKLDTLINRKVLFTLYEYPIHRRLPGIAA